MITSRRVGTAPWRAAQAIPEGSYVNLGIGIPTLVPALVFPEREVVYQSENGLVGVGPPPLVGAEDPDLINASKDRVTLLPGAAIFDSVLAFGMMRGGHLDLALMGAFEVDAKGCVANWTLDQGDAPPGEGGAMGLAIGAREIWVLMEHSARSGAPRILERCTLWPVRADYPSLWHQPQTPRHQNIRPETPGRSRDAAACRVFSGAIWSSATTLPRIRDAIEALRPVIVQFDSAHDDLGEIGACRQAGIAAMVKYFGADPAVFERIIRLKPDMINLDRADIFVAAYAKVTGKRTGLRRHLR